MQLATQLLAVLGLYAIFISLLLAALWAPAAPHPSPAQASRPREAAVTVILAGGSFASLIAIALVLWGLRSWQA
jgi:(hydroxyamino)benzene mutase